MFLILNTHQEPQQKLWITNIIMTSPGHLVPSIILRHGDSCMATSQVGKLELWKIKSLAQVSIMHQSQAKILSQLSLFT